jgi:minimal PKS acyl carrier protein
MELGLTAWRTGRPGRNAGPAGAKFNHGQSSTTVEKEGNHDMDKFTMADLVRVMRAAAGEDEAINLDGDILEVSFADLGYDSLAVMETASRVEREYGVSLPEETMATIETPKEFVELVNGQLTTAV